MQDGSSPGLIGPQKGGEKEKHKVYSGSIANPLALPGRYEWRRSREKGGVRHGFEPTAHIHVVAGLKPEGMN